MSLFRRDSAEPSSPPLFIVGVPSSGTTLLRNILWCHPRYYSTHETNFYLAAYRTEEWYEAVEKHLLGDLRRDGVDRRLAGCPEYSMEFIRNLSERHHDRRSFVIAFFEALRKYGPGRTWIEKTPRHLAHVDAIKEDFPESRVLCVTRDPRDTTLSIAGRGWFRGDYRNACAIWLQQIQGFHRHRHLIDYVVSYEELCTRPEVTVRALFEYLDIPYDHEEKTFPQVLRRPEYLRCPIFSSLDPIHSRVVGRSKRELSPEKENVFQSICGEYLRNRERIDDPEAAAPTPVPGKGEDS